MFLHVSHWHGDAQLAADAVVLFFFPARNRLFWGRHNFAIAEKPGTACFGHGTTLPLPKKHLLCSSCGTSNYSNTCQRHLCEKRLVVQLVQLLVVQFGYANISWCESNSQTSQDQNGANQSSGTGRGHLAMRSSKTWAKHKDNCVSHVMVLVAQKQQQKMGMDNPMLAPEHTKWYTYFGR